MKRAAEIPAVSVIMAAYNGGAYIAQAIESVLGQTAGDLELVIIDDGSTDNTAEVVRSYGDPRIRYVHQKNAGTSAARNHGLSIARGEFFGLLDQDDAWEPLKLERQFAHFREHPGLSLVYTNARIIDGEGRFLRPYIRDEERAYPPEEVFFNLLARRNFICPATVLARRSVLSPQHLFDASLSSVEDYDFLMRILRDFKAGYVDEMLVLYRLHEANFSRHLRLRHQGNLRVIERYGKPFLNDPRWGGRLRAREAGEHYALGYCFFEEDRLAEARCEFQRSLRSGGLAHPLLPVYWLASFLPPAALRFIRRAKRRLAGRQELKTSDPDAS